MEPESKILIISQANVAVDNVLRGLPPMGVPQKKIVRCGNDEKISDDMKDFSLDKQVTLYNKSFSQLCRPDLQPYRKIWRSMMQSSETQDLVGEYLLKNFSVTGELLLPINRAKKVIIIGDHKQLPPVKDPAFDDESKINIKNIVDEGERDKFFKTSFFEKLYKSCPNDNKCMLNIQFRMLTRICEMVNDLFYEGKLHSSPTCDKKFPLFFGNNIFFMNMDGDSTYCERQYFTEYGNKTGPYNEREIEVAVALIKKLRANFSERIAVITPYRNQNRKLPKDWKKAGA